MKAVSPSVGVDLRTGQRDRGHPRPRAAGGPEDFLRVYSDPAADGRSRGAGLSDLFWYWLAPGPQMHQEHLEPGERYRTVARTTRQVLAVPHARSDELATAATRRILDTLPPVGSATCGYVT